MWPVGGATGRLLQGGGGGGKTIHVTQGGKLLLVTTVRLVYHWKGCPSLHDAQGIFYHFSEYNTHTYILNLIRPINLISM